MNQTIKEQILRIKATGKTNMFDTDTVALLAICEGFYELVAYLEDHKAEYVHFILTGEAPDEEAES